MPALKNSRHERFAQEIAKGKTPVVPYVYELVDPRDGLAFYVGKGRRRRAWQHIADAKAGRVLNRAKTDRILNILSAGLEVEVRIVSHHQTDMAAGDAEKARIEAIGLECLTNIMPGGWNVDCETRTNWESLLVGCYSSMQRLIPRDCVFGERRKIRDLIHGDYADLYQQAYSKLGAEKAEMALWNAQCAKLKASNKNSNREQICHS